MAVIEKKTSNGFRRVIVVDNWGDLSYHLRAAKSSAGTWATEQDDRWRLKRGMKVKIRWPNGRTTLEQIRAETKHSSVGDMGHSYDVQTERLYVTKAVQGLKVRIPLEGLEVKLLKEPE